MVARLVALLESWESDQNRPQRLEVFETQDDRALEQLRALGYVE